MRASSVGLHLSSIANRTNKIKEPVQNLGIQPEAQDSVASLAQQIRESKPASNQRIEHKPTWTKRTMLQEQHKFHRADSKPDQPSKPIPNPGNKEHSKIKQQRKPREP